MESYRSTRRNRGVAREGLLAQIQRDEVGRLSDLNMASLWQMAEVQSRPQREQPIVLVTGERGFQEFDRAMREQADSIQVFTPQSWVSSSNDNYVQWYHRGDGVTTPITKPPAEAVSIAKQLKLI